MSTKHEIENAVCVGSTDKAILVEIPELEDDAVWVPQSQIDEDSEVYKTGDEGTLIVPARFAEKRGWA